MRHWFDLIKPWLAFLFDLITVTLLPFVKGVLVLASGLAHGPGLTIGQSENRYERPLITLRAVSVKVPLLKSLLAFLLAPGGLVFFSSSFLSFFCFLVVL